jgi:hypothetical protein
VRESPYAIYAQHLVGVRYTRLSVGPRIFKVPTIGLDDYQRESFFVFKPTVLGSKFARRGEDSRQHCSSRSRMKSVADTVDRVQSTQWLRAPHATSVNGLSVQTGQVQARALIRPSARTRESVCLVPNGGGVNACFAPANGTR